MMNRERAVPTDDPSATAPSTPRAAAAYALVLLVGALVLLPALGAAGFWDPWEATYAEAAREMQERGSLLIPYYAGEPRFVEPPLVYWGVLAGFSTLGPTELGGRAAGVGLALAAMLCVGYAVSRLRGVRAGLLGALVLGSCPLFYMLARQATPDIYLASSAGSSLLFFCLAAFCDDGRRRLHAVAGGVALALAFLARGPLLAVASVIAPLALFALARLRIADDELERSWLSWRMILLAALVVLVLAAPWYAFVLTRHQDTAERMLLAVQPAPDAPSHGDAFGYYLRGWIFGFFPWSCFLPLAPVILALGARRSSGFEVCLFLSAVVSFLLVNMSDAKFPQSLALVTVPVAVLVALTVDRMLSLARPAVARLAWSTAAILYLPPMLDLARGGGLKYLFNSFTFERDLPQGFDPGGFVPLLLLLGLVPLIGSILFRSRWFCGAFVSIAILLAVTIATRIGPEVGAEKSMKGLCRAWRSAEPSDKPLGIYGEITPSVRFYTAGQAVVLGGTKAFMDHLAPESPAFAIVSNEQLVPVDAAYRRTFQGHRLHVVDRGRRGFMLLGNRPPRD